MNFIKKKVLTAILSATVLFSAVGFSACGNSDLEAKLAKLELQITQLQDQNKDLQASVIEQQEQITHLEQDMQELEEEIAYLESQINENVVSGTFYSLEEAYDLGFINKNDLKNIIYHYMGTVYQVDDNNIDSSNWIELDFIPEKELNALDDRKEFLIKSSFIYHNKSLFLDMNDEEAVKSLSVEFLGEYNGCYAVIIDSELWGYGGAIIPHVIDGIGWWQNGAKIRLFVEKK